MHVVKRMNIHTEDLYQLLLLNEQLQLQVPYEVQVQVQVLGQQVYNYNYHVQQVVVCIKLRQTGEDN